METKAAGANAAVDLVVVDVDLLMVKKKKKKKLIGPRKGNLFLVGWLVATVGLALRTPNTRLPTVYYEPGLIITSNYYLLL